MLRWSCRRRFAWGSYAAEAGEDNRKHSTHEHSRRSTVQRAGLRLQQSGDHRPPNRADYSSTQTEMFCKAKAYRRPAATGESGPCHTRSIRPGAPDLSASIPKLLVLAPDWVSVPALIEI
jgi:hypothetical protein